MQILDTKIIVNDILDVKIQNLNYQHQKKLLQKLGRFDFPYQYLYHNQINIFYRQIHVIVTCPFPLQKWCLKDH